MKVAHNEIRLVGSKFAQFSPTNISKMVRLKIAHHFNPLFAIKSSIEFDLGVKSELNMWEPTRDWEMDRNQLIHEVIDDFEYNEASGRFSWD